MFVNCLYTLCLLFDLQRAHPALLEIFLRNQKMTQCSWIFNALRIFSKVGGFYSGNSVWRVSLIVAKDTRARSRNLRDLKGEIKEDPAARLFSHSELREVIKIILTSDRCRFEAANTETDYRNAIFTTHISVCAG